MKNKKGFVDLIAMIKIHLLTSLLKVSGATRVTAFVLVAIKPKPKEAKYDRNNKKWKNKVNYKTDTNEVRKQ